MKKISLFIASLRKATHFLILTLRYVVHCSLFACLFLASCDKRDEMEEPEPAGYFNDQPMASDEVVAFPTAIIGDIPGDIGAALNIRFTNQTAQIAPSSTQVIIFHINSLLTLDEEAFLEVYHNDGIIIVLDPDHQLLSAWLEELELSDANRYPIRLFGSNDPDTPHELYAFNRRNNHYFLDYVHSDFDHNDFLNSLVSWVNQYGELPVSLPLNASPSDVTAYFAHQSINYTYNLFLDKIIVIPEGIKRSGQIDVRYIVYPLYAFEDQESNGDYYIVSMSVTAHNGMMYKGKWWLQGDRSSLTALCGFYMEKLGVKTEILTDTQTAANGASFASFGTPTPLTTIGKTTYSHGLSWYLNCAVTGEGGVEYKDGVPIPVLKAGATLSGGVTYNNTQTRVVSDIEIHNNWTGATVDYSYIFNNLPTHNGTSDIIPDPPPVSVNDADFHQDWVWRVSSTTDNGQQAFVLKNTINPQMGSGWFTSVNDHLSHWSDAVVGNSFFTVALTPPYRTPTGELHIYNSMPAGTFVTEIKIWKSTSSTAGNPDFTVTVPRSFAAGATAKMYLPVGSHWVEFKAGTSPASLTSYHLSTPVTIKRAETTSLNSGFDFDWGGY